MAISAEDKIIHYLKDKIGLARADELVAELKEQQKHRQQERLVGDIYSALHAFQQAADWPQLRLAQMRQHLAEHIARELMPGPTTADRATET
jgi:hypothetical protein